MRTRSFVLLAILASSPLLGCPQPSDTVATEGAPPPGSPPPGDPGAPPPGDAGAMPPGDPGAAPADAAAVAPTEGNAPPADGPQPGGPPSAPFKPAGLASLIKDGKSVTLSGTITGLKVAQLDITAVKTVDGQVVPEVLEIVRVTDGTFSVKAPATFDRDLYVSVMTPPTEGKLPGEDEIGGGYSKAIKLNGADVKVDIVFKKDRDWAKGLPWFREGAPAATLPTDLNKIPGPKEGATPAPGAQATPETKPANAPK